MNQELNSILKECSTEARELYLPSIVERYDGAPSALEFHRKWVSRNIPCLFQNAINHWPALEKWECSYLAEKLGDKVIQVAVTPDGYADAVRHEKFMLPMEESMTFASFIEKLFDKTSSDAYYIQKQNSNLTIDFPELLCDVDSDFTWANEAFNCKPDAVNFWMGEKKAVTSLHKDHYENLYCVIKGEKTFTLIPPSDRPFIPYKTYPCYKHFFDKEWKIRKVCNLQNVPWIPIDPLKPDLKRYPKYSHARPITCKVKAGEVLYLPSLWFHHVQQADATIAVNYWYDMDFDIKYMYFQTLDKLTQHNHL
ncbi:bifunctional peptidase and (3S)-lysyl hydroxylase JMJD7-like [Ciona intestinalis]